jgi:hypothetical protein
MIGFTGWCWCAVRLFHKRGASVRRSTFAVLLDQFENLARQKPILLLFEDAHWADATCLELLRRRRSANFGPRGLKRFVAICL